MTPLEIVMMARTGAPPPPAPPSTNLYKWWKLNTGLTQSGGVASAWADQISGTVLAASGTAQPAVQADGSLLFDGVDDAMSATFTRAQPHTTYLLAKQVSWINNGGLTDGGNFCTWISGATSSPTIQMYAGSASLFSSDMAVGAWGIVCGVFNGASSVFQIDATAAVTGNPGTGVATGIVIGAHGASAYFGNWQIKEVLLYDVAHDATARAAVRTYLATIP